MKIFLDKLSVGPGQRKFKVQIQNEELSATALGFEEVSVLTNKNIDTTGESTNNLHNYNNNTLYDVDSVNHFYYTGANEDNSFRMPITRHRDMVQFDDFDFALTNEASGTLELALDQFAFFDRYSDIPNSVISYDPSIIQSDPIDIQPESTEEEIFEELSKIFGTVNEAGDDKNFVGNEYTKINPSISIARTQESLPYSYILESDLTSGQIKGDGGFVNVNPFKTKNHLKNDYNVYIDGDEFVAWRRYRAIGRNGDNLWLSYNVDQSNSSTNEYLTRNFQTIEHLEGISKFKGESTGHKSNIYSIRVHNSGLNLEGEIYEQLRNIFEKSLFNLMTKIAPAYTQLWKIEYID